MGEMWLNKEGGERGEPVGLHNIKTLIRGSHKQHHFVGGKTREYGCCDSLKDDCEVIYLKRFRGIKKVQRDTTIVKRKLGV